MSGTQTQTGNGATQQPQRMRGKPGRKASGKTRVRRTQAQIAAAAAGASAGIQLVPAKALPGAFPALQPSAMRTAQILQLFGECSDTERQRNLVAVAAIWPAKAA
jgi:hypothetical protein